MTNAWTVQLATAADKAAVAALEAEAFGERSWGAASVRESFSAPRVAILLATRGDRPPEGFAMWRDLGPEAEILTISVASASRRRGAATALLEAVRAAAKAAGAERLFLEVDAGNEAALALYGAAGFQKIGERRAYYRDGADAAVMQLLL